MILNYSMQNKNQTYLKKYSLIFSNILKKSFHDQKIAKCVKLIEGIKKQNKKIIIIGNGGSAAIASHATVDFLKVTKTKCINFNDSSLITCFANDYGHDNWMKEAINHYAERSDLLIAISSSGMSKNIINACKEAKRKKIKSIITLTGFSKNNKIGKLGAINFWVDSKVYNFVENIHQVIILAIVDCYNKTKIR